MNRFLLHQVRRLIARAGRCVTLRMPEQQPVACKAVIKPLMYKNKMYLDNEITSDGEVDSGCFLYLGPPEYRLDMASGTEICCASETYIVVRAEVIFWQDDPVYVWAIVRPVIEEGTYVRDGNLR